MLAQLKTFGYLNRMHRIHAVADGAARIKERERTWEIKFSKLLMHKMNAANWYANKHIARAAVDWIESMAQHNPAMAMRTIFSFLHLIKIKYWFNHFHLECDSICIIVWIVSVFAFALVLALALLFLLIKWSNMSVLSRWPNWELQYFLAWTHNNYMNK